MGVSTPAVADAGADANALFQEAIEEFDAEHYDVACPMLEQSYRLDAKTGTLFTLAECHAAQGKAEKASREYKHYMRLVDEMPADKKIKHAERYAVAQEQVAKLDPSIDPFKTKMPQTEDAAATAVSPSVRHIPPTSTAPNGAGTKSDKGSSDSWSGRRKAAFAITAAFGVSGIAGGSVAGWLAMQKATTIQQNCPNKQCSDINGLRVADEGQMLARISTGAFGLGGVAAAVTIILASTAKSSITTAGLSDVRVNLMGLHGTGAMLTATGIF